VTLRSAWAVVACFCVAAAAAPVWPDVATPPGAHVQTVAGDIVLNGKPTRVMRFEIKGGAKDVLDFYRTQFGAERVENRVKGDQVIATRQGAYFHTVQLHVLDSQAVQGTVMTTRLRGGASSGVSLDTERLMPASTAVVSTMQSDDGGKRSVVVVGVNQNSARANRDHIVASLHERGFRVAKEGGEPGAVSLVFASSTEEIAVTISDAGAYRAILINRVKEPQ